MMTDTAVGATFRWLGTGYLQQWPFPAVVAALYLVSCFAHNAGRQSRDKPPASTPIIDRIAVVHNVLLTAFSALVCAASSAHLAPVLRESGLRGFLCPPMPADAALASAAIPTLEGPLFFWCYVFYLSKYYELVDTALLMARGKRVIALHALHHAFIPLTMCLLFEGGVAVSLVGLAVVNSFVHVVMYAYYLAVELGYTPPLWWKRSITRLQILQFSVGVAGGTYYWAVSMGDARLSTAWPFVLYTERCMGGRPSIVLVGYVMNLMLLCLFVRFYVQAYRRRPRDVKGKRS
jgi:hypothetical protein